MTPSPKPATKGGGQGDGGGGGRPALHGLDDVACHAGEGTLLLLLWGNTNGRQDWGQYKTADDKQKSHNSWRVSQDIPGGPADRDRSSISRPGETLRRSDDSVGWSGTSQATEFRPRTRVVGIEGDVGGVVAGQLLQELAVLCMLPVLLPGGARGEDWGGG